MDVISIPKTKENFRLMYNVKRRFCLVPITPAQAQFKLCKVKKMMLGPKAIPYIVTHDGRTIRFPHPEIRVNDTVKVDLATGKIKDFIKFEVGNTAMMTGGNGMGRVGVIVKREVHPGSFEIVHIKDAAGQTFTTRLNNVFVIGQATETLVTLPNDNGVKKSTIEYVNEQLAKNAAQRDGTKKVSKKVKKVAEKKVEKKAVVEEEEEEEETEQKKRYYKKKPTTGSKKPKKTVAGKRGGKH